jgi:NitT/TauT family transport system substrate-binding protein
MRLPSAHIMAPALAGLSLTVLLAGCNLPGGSAAVSTVGSTIVTVAAVPGIDNATLALAQKNGLFASAGIKVKIDTFRSVPEELAALSSGTVDIAAGDYGDLFFAQATSRSPIFRIIADGYDAAPGVLEIMTLPDSRITSPSQLAGLRIAAPLSGEVSAPTDAPDSLAIATATSVLQSFGVNLSAVQWKNMSATDELRSLADGHVQAILVGEPYIYLAQRQLGAVELVDACSGATAGIPLSGYFTTSVWSRNNSATVAAFRSAILQAAAEASMPGPVQAVLPAYSRMSKQEAALVTVGTYPVATIAASVQRTADLMNTEGMIRFRLNVAAMIVR